MENEQPATVPEENIIIDFDFDKALIDVQPHLRRFATRYVTRQFDQDDLVSETIIKALQAREQFKPGTNFKAWTFMIMRNFALSHYRRAWREQELDMEVMERTVPDMTASAETKLQVAEALLAFDKLLVVDDDGYRFDAVRTLELYVLHQCTYEELATEMNVALGTAKSRVSRARAALREVMKLPDDI